MVVGVALIELRVHGSHSLKEKRGVARSILGRLRHRFDVSAAEVGGQDTWQRLTLGLSCVGNDAASVRARLERAVNFVEGLHLAELVNHAVEVESFPFQETAYLDSEEDEFEG